MAIPVDRRTFLATTAAALTVGSASIKAQTKQTFIAGVVASAPRPPGTPAGAGRGAGRGAGAAAQTDAERVESFKKGLDDCARLGIHYVEKSNGPDPLVDFYKGRENEFKEELAKRNLHLAGLANNCHAGRADLRQAMIDQNLKTARFVKAMNGRYIALVLDPTDGSDRSGDEAAFRKLDYKVIAANVDEMSRVSKEETGIEVGYHPEEGDSAAGLVDYLMDNTKHMKFWPDIGWMQMVGIDAVASCKKYYSRMNGIHLRDFAPPKDPSSRGIVPLGDGNINLVALIDFFREQKFKGCVMGEGQTNQSNYEYMSTKLGIQF
jgi:sugar phosphate isomerase/epimerase